MRHIERWHNKKSVQSTINEGQTTLTGKFGTTKRFNTPYVEKVIDASLRLVVNKRLPLSLFESDDFCQYLSTVLTYFDVNQESINQITPSAKTLKKYASDKASKTKLLIITKGLG